MRIEHPVVPPAARGARRGGRTHPRHGRRACATTRRSTSMQRAARRERSTRCSSAAARPRARISTSPAATKPRPTSTSASTGSSRSHFGHIDAIGERVLIIGVGNTAMDCCRTSRRLGGKDVKVIARRPRKYFKASPWELEDAEEEGVEIVENHSPKRFVARERQARRHGVRASSSTRTPTARSTQRRARHVFLPCDDVILAIGQENAFPWIERDIGIEFDKCDMPVVDKVTMQSTRAGVFFGGDAAFGPEEHHLGGRARPSGRDLDPQSLPGRAAHASGRRAGMNLVSSEDGHARVELQQRLQPAPRAEDAARRSDEALRGAQHRGRARVHGRADGARGASAASTATCRPHFTAELCIECDACIDVCPVDCLTIAPNGDEFDLRARLTAPASTSTRRSTSPAPLPQTGRVMVKDENVCVHCGLCAERCPTAAWDMQKFDVA